MGRITIPKGILLDLDNTLYEYEPCHQKGLKSAGIFFQRETGILFDDFINMYNECRREINRELHGVASSHNRLLYFQRVIERINIGFKAGLMLDMYNIYWDAFIDDINLYDGVIDFFGLCKQRDIKIALITDLTADIQLKKISRIGIDAHIDAVVTSEEAKQEKPLLPIFLLALKKIKLSPADVWVIGDSIDKDIAGGNELGAVTILLDNKDTLKEKKVLPNIVVTSFHEVIDLLKE